MKSFKPFALDTIFHVCTGLLGAYCWLPLSPVHEQKEDTALDIAERLQRSDAVLVLLREAAIAPARAVAAAPALALHVGPADGSAAAAAVLPALAPAGAVSAVQRSRKRHSVGDAPASSVVSVVNPGPHGIDSGSGESFQVSMWASPSQ